jgi:hypothetical protein
VVELQLEHTLVCLALWNHVRRSMCSTQRRKVNIGIGQTKIAILTALVKRFMRLVTPMGSGRKYPILVDHTNDYNAASELVRAWRFGKDSV